MGAGHSAGQSSRLGGWPVGRSAGGWPSGGAAVYRSGEREFCDSDHYRGGAGGPADGAVVAAAHVLASVWTPATVGSEGPAFW